ncbi:HD-GYP domain-containing protein [Ilumatobacter sp.]|uniref:HD-GYP domain-containing protein n=1 Tax=Ilumatobacter sp. TaxID=1967498 RepID=UPI0032981E51
MPFVAAMAMAFLLSGLMPVASALPMRVVRWLGIVAVSTVAMIAVDRLARRLLPLSVLLKLTLVFPDHAPSRFAVAMRTGTTMQLRARLESAREVPLGETPQAAAERLLELVGLLSHHDRLTRGHSERVRAYTHLIGDELGLTGSELDKLRWAALLHDVGKTAIATEILNKPGRLTDDEYDIVKTHPDEGRALVAPLSDWLGDSIQAVWQHHERFDGGGYPQGLSGTDISFAARVVTVADSYDVMTSARSYKKPMSAEAARTELAACSGAQFDPVVVRAFLNVSLGRLRLMTGPLAWFAQLALFEPSGIVHAGSTSAQAGGSGATATGGSMLTSAVASTASGIGSGAASGVTAAAASTGGAGLASTVAATAASVVASTIGIAAASPPVSVPVMAASPPAVVAFGDADDLQTPGETVVVLDAASAEAPDPSVGRGGQVSASIEPASLVADPSAATESVSASTNADGSAPAIDSANPPGTAGTDTTSTAGDGTASTPSTTVRPGTGTATTTSTSPAATATPDTTPPNIAPPATVPVPAGPAVTTTTTTTPPVAPEPERPAPTTTTTTPTVPAPPAVGAGQTLYLGNRFASAMPAPAFFGIFDNAPRDVSLVNLDTDRDSAPGALVQKDAAGVGGTDPTKVMRFRSATPFPIVIDRGLDVELYIAAKDFAHEYLDVQVGVYRCNLLNQCTLLGSDTRQVNNATSWKKTKFHLHGVDATIGLGESIELRVAVLDTSQTDGWFAFGTQQFDSKITLRGPGGDEED